jgi:hypothetical protein
MPAQSYREQPLAWRPMLCAWSRLRRDKERVLLPTSDDQFAGGVEVLTEGESPNAKGTANAQSSAIIQNAALPNQA